MKFYKRDWNGRFGCYFYKDGRYQMTLVKELRVDRKGNGYYFKLFGIDKESISKKDVEINIDFVYSKFEADEIMRRYLNKEFECDIFSIPKPGALTRELQVKLKSAARLKLRESKKKFDQMSIFDA